MTLSAIGATPSTGSTNLSANSTIGQADFLKIMLTQLTYQDPLKPMDNQQFIAQMAQFTNLEQTKQLTDRIDTMLSIQSANQSIGLLSKTVEISTSSGPAVGTVSTITFSNNSPELTIMLSNGQFLTGVNPSQVSVVH